MWIKFTIKNAYDSLNWEFLIFKVLDMYGFNEKWTGMIKYILKSARNFAFVNEGPCGFFGVGRRLRPMDPLAPYFSFCQRRF